MSLQWSSNNTITPINHIKSALVRAIKNYVIGALASDIESMSSIRAIPNEPIIAKSAPQCFTVNNRTTVWIQLQLQMYTQKLSSRMSVIIWVNWLWSTHLCPFLLKTSIHHICALHVSHLLIAQLQFAIFNYNYWLNRSWIRITSPSTLLPRPLCVKSSSLFTSVVNGPNDNRCID